MLEFQARKGLLLPPDLSRSAVAVLVGGGIESSILTAQLMDRFQAVYPVYVRFGLVWELVEEQHLRRFLAAIRGPHLGRLHILDLPVADTYGDHWSITGDSVPDSSTADDAVYLPGRNLLLISRTAVWCALNGIETIALGPLDSNPFPDATDNFFDKLESVIAAALDQRLRIIRPFARLAKAQVLQLGRDLPLEFSFSCINPTYDSEKAALHCGRCNKCHERQQAFDESGVVDRTRYASRERLAVPAL